MPENSLKIIKLEDSHFLLLKLTEKSNNQDSLVLALREAYRSME